MANEVAVTTEKRRGGLTALLAARFDMEPAMFLNTIKATVMPSTAKDEEVCAFLMVAHEYGLNPILREIHAFPKKGGGIQTVVGVDGWAKLISSNPAFDGLEFSYEDAPDGSPVAVTCAIYRKGCTRPIKVTEYYKECNRGTDPWKQMPKRMLRHKALMQCGRVAFGLAGITDEDEARDILPVAATVIDDPLAPGRHKRGRPAKVEMSALPTPEEAKEGAFQPQGAISTAKEEPEAIPMSGSAPCEDYTWIAEARKIHPGIVDSVTKGLGLPEGFSSMDKFDGDMCKRVRGRVKKEIEKAEEKG
jgi:phage recombination protein Bet